MATSFWLLKRKGDSDGEYLTEDEAWEMLGDYSQEDNGYAAYCLEKIFTVEEDDDDETAEPEVTLWAYKETGGTWVYVPQAFETMTLEWAEDWMLKKDEYDYDKWWKSLTKEQRAKITAETDAEFTRMLDEHDAEHDAELEEDYKRDPKDFIV